MSYRNGTFARHDATCTGVRQWKKEILRGTRGGMLLAPFTR